MPESFDHLQPMCNRPNHHGIEVIERQKLTTCRNHPMLNCRESSLGATLFTAHCRKKRFFVVVPLLRQVFILFLFVFPEVLYSVLGSQSYWRIQFFQILDFLVFIIFILNTCTKHTNKMAAISLSSLNQTSIVLITI